MLSTRSLLSETAARLGLVAPVAPRNSNLLSACPQDTSHGICQPCYVFYYGEARRDQQDLVKPFSTFAGQAGTGG